MSDPSDPFERLESSHRRLRERLSELERAVGSSARVKLDTIAEVLAFFERSVAYHEQDEEKSLFPRLASMPELVGMLTTLEGEHTRQHELWGSLRDVMRRISADRLEEDDAEELREIVRHLVLSYEGHIRLEEESLFPAARRALDAETQRALAREMDARHAATERAATDGRNHHADEGGGTA